VLLGTTVLGVALDAGIRWTLPASVAVAASAVRVGDITTASRLTGWHTAVEAFVGGFRAVALGAALLGVLAAVLTAVAVRDQSGAASGTSPRRGSPHRG
jgi:hypothetical protein